MKKRQKEKPNNIINIPLPMFPYLEKRSLYDDYGEVYFYLYLFI